MPSELMESNVEGGTGTMAQIPDVTVGGITGTIADFTVAWFAGTANGLSTAVWVALPDGHPMNGIGSSGAGVTGGRVSILAFARLHQAIADPTTPLPPDAGTIQLHVEHPDLPVEPPLIIGAVAVDELPAVIICSGGGADIPPNIGGPVTGTGTHTTPVAALEHFLSEAGYTPQMTPTNGYIELTQPDGSISYAHQLDEELNSVVVLISLRAVENGWTVTHWEGSGC
jgi:membrane peptidoglycan carboxypeptidase